MSYKNPQKVVSKAFDVSLGLLKAETQDLYRREAEARKQQRRFGEMATQALMNKKAQQRAFDQRQLKQEQDLYNRVASLQVGSTNFDKNSEDYFFDLIGKSNEIKRHLADNTMIDRELGKRDLARINNLVNVYGEAQPRIIKAANVIKEAALIPEGQPGSLASYGVPVDQQEIIVGITEGKDIKIVDKDGQLFLFDQEKGTKLNVNEFVNAFDNPNNPYIKRVPDIAKNLKASYDNFTQKDVNKMSQFISEETVTNSVGDKVEVKFMTPQQQDKLEDALKGRKITGTDYYSGGQFKKMLELNGNAIWEDIMPDEITLRDKNWGTWQPKSIDDPEYAEFYEKQYLPALEYLANRTIEENSGDIDLQRRYTGKVYKKQQPRSGRGGSGSSSGVDAEPLVEDVFQGIRDLIENPNDPNSKRYFKDKKIDNKRIVDVELEDKNNKVIFTLDLGLDKNGNRKTDEKSFDLNSINTLENLTNILLSGQEGTLTKKAQEYIIANTARRLSQYNFPVDPKYGMYKPKQSYEKYYTSPLPETNNQIASTSTNQTGGTPR